MKYAIDRIEEDIVVLENLESREIIEINKNLIINPHEKDIIVFENGIYKKDASEYLRREEIIREKLKKLLQ